MPTMISRGRYQSISDMGCNREGADFHNIWYLYFIDLPVYPEPLWCHRQARNHTFDAI